MSDLINISFLAKFRKLFTNIAIDAAIKLSKSRTNNRVLEIKFGSLTSINIDE